MDQHQASPVGERVFCHECEHEWVRAQHGLACPECHSDFTEVLEQGNDPRTETVTTGEPQHSHSRTCMHQHSHGQHGLGDDDDDDWEDDDDAPDPDEDDIANVASPHDQHSPHGVHPPPNMPHGLHVFTMSSGPGSRAGSHARGQPSPGGQSQGQGQSQVQGTPGPQSANSQHIPTPVRSIIESIMGSSIFGPQTNATPTTPGRPDSSGPSPDITPTPHPHALTNTPFGTTTIRSGATGPITWRVTTTSGAPQDFASMMMGGMPGFPGQLNTDMRHVDVNDEPMTGSTPGLSALSPFPANVFNVVFGGQGPLSMLAHLVDPANMQHGDAVYSQEALDRIISQLMEQHTSGSAPGPASNEAITALPTRKITSEDLGSEGKAECSICMDEVNIEEQVTVLPCHHWFHGDCVKAWLGEHDTCPHCRQSIMPKASDPDPDRLRSPHEEPRHDHTLGSALTPGEGTSDNPWTIPDSPATSRQMSQPAGASSHGEHAHTGPGPAQNEGNARAVDNQSLYNRMRSAFGEGG